MTDDNAHVPIEILLVEDNPGDIRLTKEALRDGKVGNRLHVVMDGANAMAFLRKEPPFADVPTPDLVLLDLNLPRKSGREVLDEIKHDDLLKHIPVVILTSSQAEQDVLSSYRLRANAFVTKPVNLEQFLRVVQSIEHFWVEVVKTVPHMTPLAAAVPIHVLLAEDNPGDARLIVELLRDVKGMAFEAETARDLQSSVDRLSRTGIDVVLLDLGLPDSQGLDTFVRLKSAARGAPIVVISGLDDERVALDAVRAGAQDYLVKGQINGDMLARVIRYSIERKRAEAALAASEAHYRTILENVDDSVFVTDLNGRYFDVNPQACKLTGRSRRELIGLSATDIYVPEERVTAALRLAEVGAGRVNVFTRRMLKKDGTVVLVEGSASLLPDGRGISTLRDITDRRRAEDQIRESEQRFRELAENVHEVFFVVDPATGLALYVNPAYEKVFGHSCEHAYTTPHAWAEAIHPEDRATALANESAASGAGESRPVEYRVVRPDSTIRWVRGQAIPVRNAGGEITRLVGTAEDITDLKRTELQFHQAQKMEAIGQLAGGVAHDFNNLLTVILSYGGLQVSEFPPGDPHRADLDEIVAAATRASELTKQLLAFSRRQVLEPQVMDLNALVAKATKMLKRLIGEEIDLVANTVANLGPVRADPGELEQVLMNLVVNARDAMPNGGKITIETANTELSEAQHGLAESVAAGPYTLLAVSDTGEGMDDATKARIFEPFFTTKEVGKGTGLGLATVYGIIKQSGGHVSVYSEPGRGTTFKIYLPTVSDATIVEDPSRPKVVRGGTEAILLVEDEASVRKITRAVLERLGYAVIEADAPAAALALAGSLTQPPSLIVTDVILPGMNGKEMARELAKLWPGVRVLYLSGYPGDAIVRHGVLEEGVAFLGKPFTADGLALKVRQVLDKKP